MKLRGVPNKPKHLTACLTFWLTWYVFFGPLSDGINCGLFGIAVIFTCGYLVALAPLFLGTLNKRLDTLLYAAKHFNVWYDLTGYVHTSFWEIFFLEYF